MKYDFRVIYFSYVFVGKGGGTGAPPPPSKKILIYIYIILIKKILGPLSNIIRIFIRYILNEFETYIKV